MANETIAKINGRTHVIPEIWLAGFCQGNNCTVLQAVEWWDWQAQIEATDEWIDPPASLAALAL